MIVAVPPCVGLPLVVTVTGSVAPLKVAPSCARVVVGSSPCQPFTCCLRSTVAVTVGVVEGSAVMPSATTTAYALRTFAMSVASRLFSSWVVNTGIAIATSTAAKHYRPLAMWEIRAKHIPRTLSALSTLLAWFPPRQKNPGKASARPGLYLSIPYNHIFAFALCLVQPLVRKQEQVPQI